MSYKIDSHKLESVTKSVFYDPTWTRESGGFRNLGSKSFNGGFGYISVSMNYITTGGKIITNVNNLLSDEQNDQFIHYGEHRFIAIWSTWKYIRESPKKDEEDIKLCLASFSIEKFIDSSKPLGKLDENELHELCWDIYRSDKPKPPPNTQPDEIYKTTFIENFLRYSRMIRLNTPPIEFDTNDLNIMSYYPLTHSQRNYLSDYIERYKVNPDRVFIDDHSEQQSIKRQLGLDDF